MNINSNPGPKPGLRETPTPTTHPWSPHMQWDGPHLSQTGVACWTFEGLKFRDAVSNFRKKNVGTRTETILHTVCQSFKSIALVSTEEKQVHISVGKWN